MEKVADKYKAAELNANCIYNMATRSPKPGLDGIHAITEPSMLMLGKEDEVKRTLAYILMLLDERNLTITVSERG